MKCVCSYYFQSTMILQMCRIGIGYFWTSEVWSMVLSFHLVTLLVFFCPIMMHLHLGKLNCYRYDLKGEQLSIHTTLNKDQCVWTNVDFPLVRVCGIQIYSDRSLATHVISDPNWDWLCICYVTTLRSLKSYHHQINTGCSIMPSNKVVLGGENCEPIVANDAILRQIYESILAPVMGFYLTVTSHCPDQYCFIISWDQQHSSQSDFKRQNSSIHHRH